MMEEAVFLLAKDVRIRMWPHRASGFRPSPERRSEGPRSGSGMTEGWGSPAGVGDED